MTREKIILELQATFLFVGTVIAWTALLGQFRDLYLAEGSVLVFGGAVTNPMATPCFYGSLAFIVALFWAVTIFQSPTFGSLTRLRGFLAFCCVFAFTVFSYETAEYYKVFNPGSFAVTCAPGVPPLSTPCFYGLLAFIAAFIAASVAKQYFQHLTDDAQSAMVSSEQ